MKVPWGFSRVIINIAFSACLTSIEKPESNAPTHKLDSPNSTASGDAEIIKTNTAEGGRGEKREGREGAGMLAYPGAKYAFATAYLMLFACFNYNCCVPHASSCCTLLLYTFRSLLFFSLYISCCVFCFVLCFAQS